MTTIGVGTFADAAGGGEKDAAVAVATTKMTGTSLAAPHLESEAWHGDAKNDNLPILYSTWGEHGLSEEGIGYCTARRCARKFEWWGPGHRCRQGLGWG